MCAALPHDRTMAHQETMRLQTSGRRDMHNIAGAAAGVAARSGTRAGIARVFNREIVVTGTGE